MSAGLLLAAEHADAEHAAEGGAHAVNVDLWKTVNFLILAVGLGWLIKKYLSPYFRKRTAEIQDGIVEARKLKAEAETRAAQMEERMAHLDDEIAALREAAKKELAAEEERLKADTGRSVARMQSNAQQEIASATKQAKKELRAYSAELALELARRKVRERMTPEIANSLMDSMVSDLKRMN